MAPSLCEAATLTAHAQGPRTFRAAQCHGEGAVALVQLSEAGTARVVSDH